MTAKLAFWILLAGIALMFLALLSLNPWLGFGGLLIAVLAGTVLRRHRLDGALQKRPAEMDPNKRSFVLAAEMDLPQLQRLLDAKGIPVSAKALQDNAREVLRQQPVEVPPDTAPRRDPHKGDGVMLVRSARRPGFDVTRDGKSWLGGLPTMGSLSWPAGRDGRPLTPLAQIDLGDLAGKVAIPGLPASGSLAFFIGTTWPFESAVRLVAGGAESQPPAPLPALSNHSYGGPLRKGEAEPLVTFPRMAVDLLPVGFDATGRATGEAVEAHPRRDHSLSIFDFKDRLGDGTRPFLWDNVQRFARAALRAASAENAGSAVERWHKSEMDARARLADAEAQLARLEAGEALPPNAPAADPGGISDEARRTQEVLKVQSMIKSGANLVIRFRENGLRVAGETPRVAREAAAFLAWVEAQDPLAQPSETDMLRIDAFRARYARVGFKEPEPAERLLAEHGNVGFRDWSDAANETVLALATAPDAVLASLPPNVAEVLAVPLAQGYRTPTWGRHQMFGRPDNVQTAAEEQAQRYLILQVQSDEVMGFHWGDAGVIQFWLAPEDLAAGDWRKARVTVEAH